MQLDLDFLGKKPYDIENISNAIGNAALNKEIDEIGNEMTDKFSKVKPKEIETLEDIKSHTSNVSC